MRALRSCDFCGDQAAGTFEIVPDELDPTEAERRRTVLCESCKDRLQTLIEPLIEHATAGRADRTARAGTGDVSDPVEADEPVAPADESTETDTSPPSDGDEDGLIGADSEGTLLGDSGTTEGDSAGSRPSASDSSGPQSPDAEQPDGPADGEDSDDGSSVDAQSGDDQSPPDNYGKVLRLLRNREFPMSREEVVTIATSAYQLDARNVQEIIDESIERGEFVEANGQLEQR
ncbi:hypothetical protein GRX03_04505 [Halovenus sp. WSH3]|uniref:Uncharacterized protein n=1 Tax=Halovenus carboxidivorans TaxID=2692199 RepID=A0A6B0SYL9_9EURY|nr:hypothetical protein [Halovenus carboxidivorans]MXR50868.1 hypothetical protein [Halovenus carboxidivorans]